MQCLFYRPRKQYSRNSRTCVDSNFKQIPIVGGFIKIYSYKLVPMIIAENPELSAKEAIKLSEDMMKGYKWRAFLIDLSFIGWDILNILTLQILGVFFLEPYKRMTTVELYMTLREKAKERDIENADRLCDKLLESEVTSGIYPINEYFITVPKGRSGFRKIMNVITDYRH